MMIYDENETKKYLHKLPLFEERGTARKRGGEFFELY